MRSSVCCQVRGRYRGSMAVSCVAAMSLTCRSITRRRRCTTAPWSPTSNTTSTASRHTSTSFWRRLRLKPLSPTLPPEGEGGVGSRAAQPAVKAPRTQSLRREFAGAPIGESRLRYLPLGGLGEVGINMWALEWQNQVLVIDAGLMFPQEDMLGIDLVLPDISYLLEKGRKVLGIFLSHGHEDHIGGLPFALKKLNVPVYGTRLTLGLVKPKLKEHRILRESDLREVRVGDSVQLGPFRVETVAVCHSIPDAVALAIQTPVGRVVYTSDFKLDPAPPDGYPTDMERFRRLGDEGVQLLLSDSTNSERSGRSGSERDLHAPFERIFGQAPGRIVVANFASNIHRIQHLVRMAVQFDRKVAVVGRSLQTNFKTARELGFLRVPDGLTVPIDEI